MEELRHPLATTAAEVARLTRHEREQRVRALLIYGDNLIDTAIAEHITSQRRSVSHVVTLFSGGNDSTVLAHAFRDRSTYAAHANTTVGIERTRQFVRDTCAAWGLPLIERTPPNERDHYASIVREHGFPGPGHHFKMFQRLKERGLRQVVRELNPNHRQTRIVFLAGRRRDESERRAHIPEVERRGSVVWVSPLAYWTKLDLNTYRLMQGDVPVNEVSDLIHMSGECLCGSFAHPGERGEVAAWFPELFEEIAELEAEIADRADIPDHRKTWGWGSDPQLRGMQDARPSAVGALCSSCSSRFGPDLFDGTDA